MAREMLKLLHSENTFQQYVEDLEHNKHISWKKYDAQHCLFPTLSEQDVRNITFGKQTLFLQHDKFSVFLRGIPGEDRKKLYNGTCKRINFGR